MGDMEPRDVLVQACAVALLVVTTFGARRAWRTLGHHRAVLRARALEASWYDIPLSRRREVGGERLAVAARAALRTHTLVVVVCAALLGATAVAWARTAATSIGPYPPALGFLSLGVMLAAAVLGRWSQVAVDRVEAASPRGRLDGRPEQAGVLLFVVALLVIGMWALSLRAARLEAEPPRLVTATITECTIGKQRTCTGRWEVDGRVYSRPVRFSVREGDVLQFEVAASRPDLVLPQQVSPVVRYGPVFGSIALVGAAVWWLRCARSLRRALRGATRTDRDRAPAR